MSDIKKSVASPSTPNVDDGNRVPIEGTATISMVYPHRQPEMLFPKGSADELTTDILVSARNRLLSMLSGPPPIERLKQLLDKVPSDPSIAESIISLFALHRFAASDEHLSLLRGLKYLALSPGQQITYHICLVELLRVRKEHSLALEHAETALELARNNGEPSDILSCMTATSLCLAQLDDPRAEACLRDAVAFGLEHLMQDKLAWPYRNWSTYLWRKGRYAESVMLLEREAPLQKREDPESYITFLFHYARRQEIVDIDRALATCREAADFINSQDLEGKVTRSTIAAAHYEIAAILYRRSDDLNAVIRHAHLAYQMFDGWIGYEIRAAWCAATLAAAYQELDDTSNAEIFDRERTTRLARFGDNRDKFKALAKRVLAGDAAEDDLRNLEALVVGQLDPQLHLQWHCIMALNDLTAHRTDECMSKCVYALTITNDNESRLHHAEAELADVYFLKAECHLERDEPTGYLESMSRVVELTPSNQHARWLLCYNAFVFGAIQVALEQAVGLVARNFGPGAYRVASRCHLAQGHIDAALDVLSAARVQYPGHRDLPEEYQEMSDIKLGLLTPSASKHFKPRLARIDVQLPTLSPTTPPPVLHGLPEYRRLTAFKRELLDIFVEYLHGLQKTLPRFVSDFRAGKAGLEEADFRDDIERISSSKWRDVGAETRRGLGRTDLILRSPSTPETLIAEFKVWGRNDYKDVASQVLGYLTDLESFAIVFMVNSNRSNIATRYTDTTIFGQPSYVPGSFRRHPIVNERLDHFYSRHQSLMGKSIDVFHFIYNIMEGPPDDGTSPDRTAEQLVAHRRTGGSRT